MRLTLVAILFIQCFVMDAFAMERPEALVYQLRTSSIEQVGFCTATLLNVGGTCRLVTNAHCVRPQIEILPFHPSETQKAYFGSFSKKELVRLKRFDPKSDIAELSVPHKLKSACESLSDVEERVRKASRQIWKEAFVASGFHRNNPLSVFTAGIGSDGNSLYVSPRRVSTSLTNLDFVFEVPHLEMTNGLSGGSTLGRDSGKLLGINKSFVPFQGRTFVIPARDVIAFLRDNSKIVSAVLQNSNSDGNTKQNGGENSGAHGGENSGAHGGENSGAHGGENSGAHGGENSTVNELKRPTDSLEFLREPKEGVLVGNRRLLAAGQMQIDGFDDLREFGNETAERIWFDDSVFLAGRTKLMSRLAGRFSSVTNWNEKVWMTSGSAEKLIVKDLQLGFKTFLEGQPKFDLDIRSSGKTFQIRLSRDGYDVIGGTLRSRTYFEMQTASVTRVEEIFTGQYSNDGKSIALFHNGNRLDCENDNFLKLICSSVPGAPVAEEFSLSRKSLTGEISFRYSFEKSDDQGNKTIIYRYGRAGVLP